MNVFWSRTGCLLAALPLMVLHGWAGSVHVWSGGGHEEPYDTWANAATNIQTAVDYAAANAIGIVLLTNETFSLGSRIMITNAITLRGAARDTTILLGQGDSTTHRALYVDHAFARVESLTVTNFYCSDDGCGVYLNAGTLDNCLVTRCRAWKDKRGVGVYVGAGGVVTNCLIRSNYGRDQNNRGAVYVVSGGIVTHSIIQENYSLACGGVYVNGGTLRRSDVINNTGNQYGDGTAVQLEGGGVVEFCVITNNVFTHDDGDLGGGIYLKTSGRVRNCLIANNCARGYGGGVYMTGGLIESCTIASNRAANGASSVGDGGGIYATAGTISNTIVYGNMAAIENDNLRSGSAAITYSLSDPAPDGATNLGGDPKFCGSGDCTLSSLSPCIDQGANQEWMTVAVDLAERTRMRGTVDVGAYEWQPEAGTVIRVR